VGFVPDLLSYARTHAPNHPAAVAGERSLTFTELDVRARRLVRLFRDLSLEAGDIVALLAKNEAEYFELHIAAMRAGLALLPLNCRLALPELQYIVDDCRPKLLICGEEFSAVSEALHAEHKCILGAEYDALLAWWRETHPGARVDRLGVRGPDFSRWFCAAVDRVPRGPAR